ncbi:hypothetical protein OPS25_06910 [Alteromonas ponticola]|uniref:Uncharacterized protein n=1 Tax=Alteromonas aquimaris TaxID=2998417 RepID=A0ABT3P627_9ALTE|nr:hypothetical protein [Alteromonas aquimaris]MCW8108220.1 hypothetical protein [Alteromonas aquimaris]
MQFGLIVKIDASQFKTVRRVDSFKLANCTGEVSLTAVYYSRTTVSLRNLPLQSSSKG